MKLSCLTAIPAGVIRRGQARGFTLIEVLVSLVLGLLVLAGVIQVYLSNQQTTRYQQALANVQENGRFALDLLARNLRMARYNDPDTGFDPCPIDPDNNPLTPPLYGLSGSDGASGASDTVITRFEGGNNLRDCLGNPVAASTAVQSTFAVNTTNGELVCATLHSSSATITTQPLATGIENMQVLYGEDTDGDGIANHYVTVANLVSWNNVVSLRVSLLVNSVTPGLPQPDTICLGCLTFTPSTADRLIRAEFTTTVGLRNQ